MELRKLDTRIVRPGHGRAFVAAPRGAHCAGVPQCVSLPERPIRAQDGRALPSGWINERVKTSDWDNSLGGVFHGPCWCATSLLLTAAELPSVYAQRDTGVAESFDVVTARWREGALELHNLAPVARQVRVAVETAARAAKTPLRAGWIEDLSVVTLPAGATVVWQGMPAPAGAALELGR